MFLFSYFKTSVLQIDLQASLWLIIAIQRHAEVLFRQKLAVMLGMTRPG